MTTWLQKEYKKCRQFCKEYGEYEKISYLMRYEPKLKTKQTQLKYELLGILENIIEE